MGEHCQEAAETDDWEVVSGQLPLPEEMCQRTCCADDTCLLLLISLVVPDAALLADWLKSCELRE